MSRVNAVVMFMSPFTSDRERRLWFWALAVVVAIYSTLGLAGTLAEVLRENNLLNVAFAVGFLLVVAAIIGSGLKRRSGRGEIWVALGVMAVYGMIVVRMGVTPEERTHLFEYGLVAVLTVAVTALLGWLDEGIQGLLPSRIYDLRDVGVNALAGLMAVAATLALARAGWWKARARSGRDR